MKKSVLLISFLSVLGFGLLSEANADVSFSVGPGGSSIYVGTPGVYVAPAPRVYYGYPPPPPPPRYYRRHFGYPPPPPPPPRFGWGPRPGPHFGPGHRPGPRFGPGPRPGPHFGPGPRR